MALYDPYSHQLLPCLTHWKNLIPFPVSWKPEFLTGKHFKLGWGGCPRPQPTQVCTCQKKLLEAGIPEMRLGNLESILQRYSDVFAKCFLYAPCNEFDGKT